MTIGSKITSGYAVALGVLVLISALAYNSTSQLIRNNERVERTYKLLTSLGSLYSLLKDAETGQRGFLLTGKDSYLQPYNTARADIPQLRPEVRSLMQDTDAQRGLDEIKPLIDKKLAELDRTI